ncbi:hypothetical protein MMC20_003143 [Loxospora ochrophaea]|nr:hypothetical protein [Loxospora ochrophaea]
MARFALSLLGASYLPLLVCSQSMGFDAREATIDSVHRSLFTRLASCRCVVSSFLSRIETLNSHVNAIITLNPNALSIADSRDDALAAGNATGPLFCVPILLKDNWDTIDMKTTAGNLDLASSQPIEDAPATAALKRAGAIVLGKTNLHELALEGISVSSLGGQTINPYDSTRTPGGSSGGTGAAVASSFSVFGTGTDTVNSLRSPASANSLYSVRPTRGLITRAGIVPISYTQDAIGPIGRTISDLAVALTVLAGIGFDPNDNTTALVPASSRGLDYSASLTSSSLKGIRLGILSGFFNRTASNETIPVNVALDSIIAKLQSAGAVIISVNESIYNATAISDLYDVQRFEYRQEMDAYLQQKSSLGGSDPETLNELYSSGKFLVIPSQYEYVTTSLASSTSNITYNATKSGILNLTLALHETFAKGDLDAVIYPEQKNLVVPIGASSQSGRNGILAALAGFPVTTVPAGFSPMTATAPVGIPIGMEILGRPWTEETLLQIAYQIELLTKTRRMPSFAEQIVESKNYTAVPSVVPNRSNVPKAYPIGVL